MLRVTACVAAVMACVSFGAGSVAAQQATPVAATPSAGEGFSALFVQAVPASILEADPGSEGGFALIFTDVVAQTVVFADRPNRYAGTVPTSDVVDAVNRLAEDGDPANAALVGQLPDGSEEIVIVELLGAELVDGSLAYAVRFLGADAELSFALESEPLSDLTGGRDYGVSTLFIDDIWCLLDGRC